MKYLKLLKIFLMTFTIGVIFTLPFTISDIRIPQKAPIKESIDFPKSKENVEAKLEVIKENRDWEKFYDSDFKIKLQRIGEGFHGNEVEARHGENWLGFFKGKEGFYLRKSKVKILRVFDPMASEFETRKTGKDVSVQGKKQPIYLLKNADFLKAGKITTSFGGNPNSDEFEENVDYIPIEAGFKKDFKFGNSKYSILAKKGVNKKGKKIIALIVENEDIRQTIHSKEDFSDGDYIGTLYWIGDLDRDGKPDFFISPWIWENTSKTGLYLSSKAEKDKLVKWVASYTTTGC